MMYSQRQPMKTRQFDITKLFITFNGVGGANTIGGLDAKFVSSVTDLGAGNYKIIFKDKARRALVVPNQPACFTDGLYCRVTASDTESVTVLCKTFAGVATDASIGLEVVYHANTTLY